MRIARTSRESSSRRSLRTSASNREVTLLDYGAGNIRSVRNAIKKLGFTVLEVEKPSDISNAQRLVFPGVGAFGQAMRILKERGLTEPLKDYIQADRPFFGICLGLQLLFDGSEESGGCEGLGIVPGQVTHFDRDAGVPIPHIGWNDLQQRRPSGLLSGVQDKRVYFVHSFRATPSPANADWVLSTTNYAGADFVSALSLGNISACQFHPEKSGNTGLGILNAFLDPGSATASSSSAASHTASPSSQPAAKGLAKRVIACLDVRSNDSGDLVVTKGDQYDVREKGGERDVRNLGKPVELAGRYYDEGADEVTFLNIMAFRDDPLGDAPMLEVLRKTSERVFVPLTVGGGIKGFVDAQGRKYSALEVAAAYFKSGADKISIGSDSVDSAQEFYAAGGKPTGNSSIEAISQVYGRQAVVVSIDPRRVYVSSPESVPHITTRTRQLGPKGEEWVWWQCTVKGGREGRDLGAVELAKAVEALGAGEILLNCIDRDGAGTGFDLELVNAVAGAVRIPVIASSGAGKPEHFSEVFNHSPAAAALAAGIFHREEVTIREVKQHMASAHIPTRL
ncbi:MAG: hypothetical protein WDW36_008189 [Sanguina aurantia]